MLATLRANNLLFSMSAALLISIVVCIGLGIKLAQKDQSTNTVLQDTARTSRTKDANTENSKESDGIQNSDSTNNADSRNQTQNPTVSKRTNSTQYQQATKPSSPTNQFPSQPSSSTPTISISSDGCFVTASSAEGLYLTLITEYIDRGKGGSMNPAQVQGSSFTKELGSGFEPNMWYVRATLSTSPDGTSGIVLTSSEKIVTGTCNGAW